MGNTDNAGLGENHQDGTTPTAEQLAAAEREAEAFFGADDDDPPDPAEAQKTQESEKQNGKDDLASKGTTPGKETSPNAGEEEEGKEEPDPSLYAGKFKTPEAMEHGYNSLRGEFGKISGENKTLRDEIAAHKAEIAQLKAGSGSGEQGKEPPKGGTTPADGADPRAAILQKLDSSVDRARTAGFDDETVAILDSIVGAVKELVPATKPKESERDPEVEEMLRERREQKVDARLRERLPEWDRWKDKVKETVAEYTGKADDPDAMTEVIYYAAIGKHAPEVIDKAVISRIERMTKADFDKIRAGLGGGGLKTPGRTERTTKTKEQEDEAFFSDSKDSDDRDVFSML